ncbi:hypothetical protein PRZ48_002656 [Zasmidium cellare]|uniref:Glycoside hydrolase family 32 protein n=1 Tax=Zasmidium cellare TaxID=395010 RepID=A0ABR0ET93_ZASCE|nr:hypothetical protein PRZ48_002656 [Zasmidium cellare]
MLSARGIDYNAAPLNLSTLTNNSIFETWRPRAHVLPPSYHIGDPCMHYTDPRTGLFHVGFLYTSNTTGGAAGATTDDLVTYRDTNPDDVHFIVSGGINDPVAVFDGSAIPSGINNTPTLLYTSVSYLPIQWTAPYTKGSETQSLAVSYDGGANFTKVAQGPSIPGAPFGVNVTGFRDPYVFQSPQMDLLLGSAQDAWYTLVSGGEHGVGPATFIYRQYDADFRDWEYLGKLWSEAANSTWGDGTWAGRWGFNFEVVNAMYLNESGFDVEGDMFLTLGAEWSYEPIQPQVSDVREMLWVAGETRLNDRGLPVFQPSMAGYLDWGRSSYAAAGKLIPSTAKASQSSAAPDRFVSYTWLTNDFYGTQDFPIRQQGWDGALTTARELFRAVISNVVYNDRVQEIASWRVSRLNNDGTVELATLGQRIAREALHAFKTQAVKVISEPNSTIGNGQRTDLSFSDSLSSKHFLLTATLEFPLAARGGGSDVRAGFTILSSEHESTTIYYQFSNESLIIDRSNSSAAAATTPGIDTSNEAGKLRLFDLLAQDGTAYVEPLQLSIVVDGGVVEVYANERFVLSTWVWTWYDASNNVAFYHQGSSTVQFSDVRIFEGLVDAWPGRSDSSRPMP